ncbi:MAG: oligoribonuclease [Frankiales bacterium]|jgi:oligoribonuclease|nr:oligoribonuclease [Frankiales bacterium]
MRGAGTCRTRPRAPARRLTGVSDRLVWIDCEMTGLDLGNDLLIEVAALVTDSELNVLGEGVDVVIGASEEQMARMPDVVRDMHAASGLTQEVLASTVTLQEAEQQVLAYIKHWVPEPKKAPLCGNSIATDRGFLTRDMTELDDWLHYRMVDVSSVKELARRWYPRAYYNSPKKGGGHRALADIKESVLELTYYRQAVFVPQPGPSTDEAVALAAALVPSEAALPEPSERVAD